MMIIILLAVITLAIILLILSQNIFFPLGDDKMHNHTLKNLSYDIFYVSGKKSGSLFAKEIKSVDLKNTKGVNFYLDGKLFLTYLNRSSNFMSEDLHVGKVVAKHQHETTSSAPLKDMANIRIHNMTNFDLSFVNNEGYSFKAPANQMMIYEGVDKEGVTINEVLKNTNGIFKDFKIKRTVTDIYYGVISDSDVPTFTQRYLKI